MSVMSSYPPRPPGWVVSTFVFIVLFLLLGTWVLSSRSVIAWVCFVGFLAFVFMLIYECIRDAHAKQVQREQWRREREEFFNCE